MQEAPLYPGRLLPYDFFEKLVVTFLNDFHAALSTSLSWSSTFTSCINSLIWGPTNTPSLNLDSLILGNILFKHINLAVFYSLFWRNFLLVQVLCAKEVSTLFRVCYWSIYYIFLSWNKRFWNKRFSLRPFFNVTMLSVPTVPLAHKATKLYLTKTQTKQDSNDLLSSQMFKLFSTYRMFSRSSFIFSQDSFMLAVWVSVADWNLFPLCRSTILKPNLVNKVNKQRPLSWTVLMFKRLYNRANIITKYQMISWE